MKFTLKDQSTQPYAWMLENVNIADIAEIGAKTYVKDSAEAYIDGFGVGNSIKDWMANSGEFEEAVAYIQSEIDAAA
jgi:hypothetical protein